MAYKQMSTAEKRQYSKRYSKSQISSYRKGKRNGWLECYHGGKSVKNKVDFNQRTYSKDQNEKLFSTLNQVKI